MSNLKISVRLDADGRTYVAAMDQAEKATKDFIVKVDQAEPAINSLRNSMSGLRGVVAGLGLGLLAREAMQFADASAKIAGQLKFATDASGSYAQAQADVNRIAREARIELGGVATLYARMKVAGDDLGASQQTVATVTENVAKGLKVFGASGDEAAAVMTQFSQALNKGKLDGDEFKSVLENAPIITKALTQELGVTKGALLDMAADGKLSAQTLMEALSDPNFTAELNRQFDDMPKTFGDSMNAIKNLATVVFGEFNRGGQFSQALFDFADVGEESMQRIADAAFNAGADIRVAFAGLRGVFEPLFEEALSVWNRIKGLNGGGGADSRQRYFQQTQMVGQTFGPIAGYAMAKAGQLYYGAADAERDKIFKDRFQSGVQSSLQGIRAFGDRPTMKPAPADDGKGKKKTSEAERRAAQELRQLKSDLESLTAAFSPADAAAARYAESLSKISRLQGKGMISSAQADELRMGAAMKQLEEETKAWDRQVNETFANLGETWRNGMGQPLVDVSDEFTARTLVGVQGVTAELKEGSVAAAQAFAQVLGGKLGNAVGQILGVIEGAKTGNYNSVGGRLGGLMTLFGSKQSGGPFTKDQGFTAGVKEFSADLKKTFKGIFGDNGPFSGTVGKTLGKAFAGAQFGGAIGKGVTNALGIRGSSTGGQLGGALGGAIGGPLGAAIGGTLGSIVGGALKKSKTGSTSIGFADGGLSLGSTSGNSQAFREQSQGLAQSIMGNLTSLADQLGAVITGSPTVSVGMRNGKPVVDTTGQNRTKGAGVVKFKKGEEAAAAAFAQQEALKDLFANDLVQGLSSRVKAALQSSTDLDKALKEALKVDEIERLLDGFGGVAKKAFVDFERQAKERLRIAGKYGFDLVKLEELNAKERNKLFESSVDSAVGSLKNLLEDLTTGERAPGTLLDRREALIRKRDSLVGSAATDADAANKLADVLNQLDQINLEAFGTAGAQFAADRAGIKSTAQAIIEQATADLKAAQSKAMANAGTDATAKAIADANAAVVDALDEGNDQRARMLAALERIAGKTGTGLGIGGFAGGLAGLDIGANYR